MFFVIIKNTAEVVIEYLNYSQTRKNKIFSYEIPKQFKGLKYFAENASLSILNLKTA